MPTSSVHLFHDRAGRLRRVTLAGKHFRSFQDTTAPDGTAPDATAPDEARQAVMADLADLGVVIQQTCTLTDEALVEMLKIAQADAAATAAANPNAGLAERRPAQRQFCTSRDFSEHVNRVRAAAAARAKAAASTRSLEERLGVRPPAYLR